jgi:hypothetical protein
MYIFILEYVSQLTGRYHSGGGLVIVAEGLLEAQKMILDSWPDCQPENEEWESAIVYPTSPDAKPHVYVFPDAGCC